MTHAADTPSTALTTFTPVPGLKDRSNGWKPHVQRAFIAALAETGSVRAACQAVGRSDHGAYQLRRHPDAHEFRAAWDEALDYGVKRIEDAAVDRAIYGTEETIHYHGDLVATRRRYNERLVMFILRSRLPDRYTDGRARGLNALDRQQLEKLKQEWLTEYLDRHQEEEVAHAEATLRNIEQMHRNWYTNMSPAARAAYRVFRRIERESRNWTATEPDTRDAAAIEGEYKEVFTPDPRAPIQREMESKGWFVDEVLKDDTEAKAEADRQTVARVRTLKDDSW